MSCEICGKDTGIINILPIRQENGNLNTLGCTDCGIEKGVFCIKHDRPHMGFDDNTSACTLCIEEEVISDGEQIAKDFLSVAEDFAPSGHLNFILGWAQEVSEIMNEDSNRSIARGIVTAAKRLKVGNSEIITRFRNDGPGVILPWLKQDNDLKRT